MHGPKLLNLLNNYPHVIIAQDIGYVFKIRHVPLFQELLICQTCNQII